MTELNQVFTPLPSEYNNRILCYYMNPTNQIQIARIVDIPNWFFERVVFPKQRLCFEAIPDAYVEIFYKNGLDRVTLSVDNPRSNDERFHAHCCKISCNLLRVNEKIPLKQSSNLENRPLRGTGERTEESPLLVIAQP